MIKIFFATASALLATCLAAPAEAQTATRAWVSGKGTDASGCGAPTDPCRSLQYVHDSIIEAGGEIDILDPAGYGAVTISKALSIINDGVGTAGVQAASGANAITINAGSTDLVYLRGLSIEGLGTGKNGIQLNSAGTFVVETCAIQHFSGSGINIQPSSGTTLISILNSVVSDNSSNGVYIYPQGSAAVAGTVSHAEISRNGIGRNGEGLAVRSDYSTAYASSKITVSDTSSNYNGEDGYSATGGALVITRSIGVGNVYGIGAYNGNDSRVGTVYTYGDNRLYDNTGNNVNGSTTTLSGN
jgi:hypothetical protein